MARVNVKVPETLPAPEERRRIREAAGISGAALASQMGVSPASVYAWETSPREPKGLQRRVYADALRQLREATKGRIGNR